MCLDARDQQPGTQLMLWECNGQPQQTFGYIDYDSATDSGQVALGDSSSATFCVDVAGGDVESGALLQVWECNGLPQQSFTLKKGITIRSGADYQVCLDLAGGEAQNGAEVEVWECNGLINQQWIFESGSNAIKWAGDSSYCIDSGALEEGRSLFLWECNGLTQQMWGYDEGTIYLDDPRVGGSRFCLDIPDGLFDPGTAAELWGCNGCWNQQWAVVGPSSASLAGVRATNFPDRNSSSSSNFTTVNGCPPLPSPGPSPPSPFSTTTTPPVSSNVFMPDCSLAAAGWPTFKDAKELGQDAEWSSYFTNIYGEIPKSGYPICVGAFTQIPARGGQTKPTQQCHLTQPNDGELVDTMSDCCDPRNNVVSFIYNSKNVGLDVPANHWAEVQHRSFSQDKDAAWYYLVFGSAIWWNVGQTVVYKDHPDASLALVGTPCKDDAGHATPPTECEQDFPGWFNTARSQGLDSIQITHHYDCGCGAEGPSSWSDADGHHNRLCQTEIIDVNGHGNVHGGCASSSYKAGWAAAQVCNCNSGLEYTNCNGYGLR